MKNKKILIGTGIGILVLVLLIVVLYPKDCGHWTQGDKEECDCVGIKVGSCPKDVLCDGESYKCFGLCANCRYEQMTEQTQITKEQAIAIANATEEVQVFLKLYPDAQLNVKHTIDEYMACCSGCPLSIWRVYPDVILRGSMTRFCSNREECFSSRPAKCNEDIWGVMYYYPNDNTSEKITALIELNGTNGEILAKYPKLEYIKKFNYCEQDEDCECALCSGLDLPCCPCGNFIHVRGWDKLSDSCKCVNNTCTTTNK